MLGRPQHAAHIQPPPASSQGHVLITFEQGNKNKHHIGDLKEVGLVGKHSKVRGVSPHPRPQEAHPTGVTGGMTDAACLRAGRI
jgi:hypothetical protein